MVYVKDRPKISLGRERQVVLAANERLPEKRRGFTLYAIPVGAELFQIIQDYAHQSRRFNLQSLAFGNFTVALDFR